MTQGRPTTFTQEIADAVCRKMAEGLSLREICRADDMPPESTVRNWAIEDREGFSAQYARAREAQVDRWAEEILEISDDGSNDWMERQNKDGSTFQVVDHEHIARSKLRADTRKWLMSKIAPKKYGDKVMNEHSGPDGGPIKTERVERLIVDPANSNGSGVPPVSEAG